jgi:C1A family cysteine protease
LAGLPEFDESTKSNYTTDQQEFVNFLNSKSNDLPDYVSWRDKGGVSSVKDQVLKIPFFVRKKTIMHY